MKQGRADHSGQTGHFRDPTSKKVNPGGTNNLGYMNGDHATDTGTFTPHVTPLYGGRGYHAPSIGTTNHKSGSQGRH